MNSGERWRWSIYGALALAVLSVSLLATDETAYPIPVAQLILHWFFPYSFVFVLPSFYGITSWVLSSKPFFGRVILYATVTVGVLNLAYFFSIVVNWRVVEYKDAVVVGVIASIIGIGTSLVLAAIGVTKGNRRLNAAAYLVLFSVLSRYGFPLTGSPDI